MKAHIVRFIAGIVIILTCLATGTWTRRVEAADSVDSPVNIEGELEVIADCEENVGRTLFFLDTGKERLRVLFSSDPKDEFQTGDRVSFRGLRHGDEVTADESSIVRLSGEPESILPNTFGAIRVLVLLVNFQDNQAQPYTTGYSDNLLFNTANSSSVTNYYREASYGQTWVTGESHGWFTLPMNADCDANSQIATYGRQAAANAGINLAAFDKFVYVYPNIGCSYSGRGSIGGRDSWINGSLVLRTTAHELGHTLGLWHSKGMDCGAEIIGTNCTVVEYGHPADMLGATGVIGHLHPYQKERLGWVNYEGSPPLTTVESSGTYTISADSVQDSNTKGLKILRSVDTSGRRTWFYLEFRRAVGFDTFLGGNQNLLNGVLITMDTESNGADNYILDMTPATEFFSDAALQIGQEFTDRLSGVTIAPLSIDTNGATVSIFVPPVSCSMADPSISVDPAATQQVAPGSTLSYLVTVTNNNSGACTSNNFMVQPAAPVGWGVTVALPVLQVAPGVSATTEVLVTIPAAAADGPYSIAMNTVNQDSPGFAASALAGVSVYRPCNMANPSVSVNPSATQQVMPGTSLSYTVTVTNNNSGNCTSNSFVVRPAIPAGWDVTVTLPVLQVAPGGSAATGVVLTVPTAAADGLYSVVMNAVNQSSPGYSGAAAAGVLVYRPSQCMANPTVSVTPSAMQMRRPGTSVSYSMTVTNNNSSGCTNNSFNVQAAVPPGWTASVASPVLQIPIGGNKTTTVRVNVPTGATGGIYSPILTASNTASPSFSASVARSIGVYTSLVVNASADQTSYTRTQRPVITAYVTALGTPMAGARVTFTITKPNGKRVSVSVTSDANGRAAYTYSFSNSDPLGTYVVAIAASLNGATGTGSVSFELL